MTATNGVFPKTDKHFKRMDSEPNSLIKFREAKDEMSKVFSDLGLYVDQCKIFVNDVKNKGDKFVKLLPVDLPKQVDIFATKIHSIQEVISRNHMKCAFFGRTSNGKSTVINAMLGHRLVPMGIGHTTGCFIQVEATDRDKAFILLPGQTEEAHQQPIESIRDVAHALGDTQSRLSVDSVVRICWPSSLCKLLREEVVLLDSPGVDVDPNLDAWIDMFCLDADVFILVANAESTLMQTEKNFFHKVSERISKPNIFILNNRWDASANEMELVDEVRRQHSERCKQFLVDELKVCNKEEAEQRVFFVSAREVLLTRVKRDSIGLDRSFSGDTSADRDNSHPGVPGNLRLSGTPAGLAEGWEDRLTEFLTFEKVFQNILSDSAIKTKFSAHAEQGRAIGDSLKQAVESVYDNCLEQKDEALKKLKFHHQHLEQVRRDLHTAVGHIEEALNLSLNSVEQIVCEILHEEICQLDQLVNNFSRPFHADSQQRVLYKKELNDFVESSLGLKLESACTRHISEEVAHLEAYMLEAFCKIELYENYRNRMKSVITKSPFRPDFPIDCRNICRDFQEDISFRFSYSLTNLMRLFLSRNRGLTSPTSTGSLLHNSGAGGSSAAGPGIHSPLHTISSSSRAKSSSNSNLGSVLGNELTASTLLPLITSVFPSMLGRNSIAAVVGVGVIFRATGWKVLAICVSVYSGLWLYEWAAWTNKAKERAFKRQYTEYTSNKLKMIVSQTSINVGFQVKLQINTSKERLKSVVGEFENEIKEANIQLDNNVRVLEHITQAAKKLKSDTGFIDSCLVNFQSNFINSIWSRSKRST